MYRCVAAVRGICRRGRRIGHRGRREVAALRPVLGGLRTRQAFAPQRGEYETQAECRRRVEKLRVGCDTYRRIDQARRMKDMEDDLVYRIKGVLLVPEQAFEVREVEIRNYRTRAIDQPRALTGGAVGLRFPA